jgi:hypothetical protein
VLQPACLGVVLAAWSCEIAVDLPRMLRIPQRFFGHILLAFAVLAALSLVGAF